MDEVWTEQKETVTVSFVSEDGGIHNCIGVIKGECLEKLPGGEPGTVSGGRVFDGWYTEEGMPFDDTTPVMEDILVYERKSDVGYSDRSAVASP